MHFLTKYVVSKLVKEGMTQEEAIKEANRRHEIAMQVPADFGPDWIDSHETIAKHLEEEALKGNINVVIVRRIQQ